MKRLIDNIEYKGSRFRDFEYEYRLVAFVDLLGFRSFLSKHGLKEVLKSLRIFYKEAGKESFHQHYTKQGYGHNDTKALSIEAVRKEDHRITIFSDLIVISYRSTKEYINWNFNELLERLYYAQGYLMHRGLLIRGGITYGRLFHTDDYCVGPALVRAYELEYKKAFYPRVILDPKLLRFPIFRKWAEESHFLFYDYKENLWGTNLFSRIHILCSNDYSKVDKYGLIQTRNSVYYDLICLSEIIQEGLGSRDDRTVEKAKWMAVRFNETLNLVKVTIGLDSSDIFPELKLNFVKVTEFLL